MYSYGDDWTISDHGNDKDGKRKELNSLPLYRLYSLFRRHFIPERNKHHSRAVFFNLKREPGESAAETWKRILEIEKNCEFEKIMVAEPLASKFPSVIGKTTGDNNLKKKYKQRRHVGGSNYRYNPRIHVRKNERIERF